MHRWLLSVVLSLSVLLSSLVAAQDASYSYTTIDAPSSVTTVAYGINTVGQIVGSFRDAGLPGSPNRGFLKDGTRFITIDVPSAEWTEAHGINTAGQIVGTFADTTGRVHSFLKDGTTFTTIDVPDAMHTLAFGINDDGRMEGFFNTATGETHGFVTDGTRFTTIDVPDAQSTQAFGINDDGHIVGQFRDATGDHGFVTDGATFTTINVPDGQSTQARGINIAGEIVGTFSDVGRPRGFVTGDGTFATLDFPGAAITVANGINDGGQIVGWFGDGRGGAHGFVATPTTADTTPPTITVAASPATLSPPNGKLVPVTVSGAITDEGSGVSSAAYQVTDEYGQIQPSGNITPGVDGEYAFTIELQASRDAKDKDGRRYTIKVSATDEAGNEGSKSATVTVPRK
jgi:probable HAF family extracellular repeat protein